VVSLVPLIVAVPLSGAFLAPILARGKRGDSGVAALALFVGIIDLALCFSFFAAQSDMVYWTGAWRVPVGISLVVDGLTRLMLITANLVASVSLLFSIRYMQRYTSPGLYYSLFLLMIAGMNGVIVTGDLFNMFVFLEIASIAAYALVAFGTEHQEVEAGFKYLILGSIGSIFILLAVGLLYNQTGHINMAIVGNTLFGKGANRVVMLAVAFLLMGFGLKAALVPFHAWLPDAHPSAPAPVSAMLSGVLIEALGIYAISRVLFNVFVPTSEVIGIVLGLGALSMVVGAFMMIGQDDFKRLLAYCSIGQVGYIVTAIGVGAFALFIRGDSSLAAFALFGGLFHLFNHAIFKALLFLASGAVEYGTGTRSLRELGGLRNVMPVTAGCCRVGSLSLSGIPPFAGFFSKIVILLAIFQARLWIVGAVAILETVVTLIGFLKLQRHTIEGPVPPSLQNVTEVPGSMRWAMVTLAAICFLAGPGVVWFREWIIDPAAGSLVAEVTGYVLKFLPAARP
jgi:multicomponent Na+:H+ antiporter subunit D